MLFDFRQRELHPHVHVLCCRMRFTLHLWRSICCAFIACATGQSKLCSNCCVHPSVSHRALQRFLSLWVWSWLQHHVTCLQVYDLIDRSSGFYTNNVQSEYRSHTALPFRYARATIQKVAQLLGSVCCMAWTDSLRYGKQTPHKPCMSLLIVWMLCLEMLTVTFRLGR